MRKAIILVVDDETPVLRMAELALSQEGYEVHTASGAVEALSLAEQLQCGLNLLLTDMMMPGIDGHDLISRIRRLCPYIDTVVMTGGLLPEDSRTRNYRIIAKPFSLNELLGTVKEILDSQLS